MKKFLALLFALVSVSSAVVTKGALAQEEPLADVWGHTYTGNVTLEAMAPQSDSPLMREMGSGRVTLSLAEEGKVEVIGVADIAGQQALRFENMLAPAGNGSWSDGNMTLASSGEIEILQMLSDQMVSAAGHVNAASLTLHLRTTRISWEGTDGDTELDLAFTFDLESEAASSNRPEAAGSNCQVVVWQPRQIANPFGGTMSMVMVPVCVTGP